MLFREWVVRAESNGETSYACLGAKPFIRICTPAENDHINYQIKNKFGIREQVPQVAYYLIKEIFSQKSYKLKEDEDVAKILYSVNGEEGSFIDTNMSIRLQPLFNFHSEYVNKRYYKDNPKSLINKKIHVESVNLIWNSPERKYQTYKVVWSVLNDQIRSVSNLGDDPDAYDFGDFDEGDPKEIFDPANIDPEDFIDIENMDTEDLFDPGNADPDEFNADNFLEYPDEQS